MAQLYAFLNYAIIVLDNSFCIFGINPYIDICPLKETVIKVSSKR